MSEQEQTTEEESPELERERRRLERLRLVVAVWPTAERFEDDDGPAARAGVIEGMRIAAINGTDLRVPASDAEDNLVVRSRAQRLTRALADVNPGDEVELRVWQNGQYRNVRVRTVPSDSLRRSRSAAPRIRARWAAATAATTPTTAPMPPTRFRRPIRCGSRK